jgi:MYXO-CTERM domain-containing protein
MTPADCNDGIACTTDACGADGNCSNTASAGCCASAADCDDGDPCTTDACDAPRGQCSSTPGACGTGGTTGGTSGGPSGGATGMGGTGDGGGAEDPTGCGCRAPGNAAGRSALTALSLVSLLSLVAFRRRQNRLSR